MSKFLHWSDLHRELSSAPFPEPTADCPAGSVDAILLNGDINAGCMHLDDAMAIQDAWQVPVVLVWGNHEAYGSVRQDLLEFERVRLAGIAEEGRDISVLHCGEKIIGDTRILGCTLWTDFDVVGDRDMMMIGAGLMMNDYHRIGWRDGDTLRRMLPADTLAMHQAEAAWLMAALDRPFDGKTLVMTHHLPAPELLAPEAGKGEYAPAYVSDLRDGLLGKRIDAWITGHTHWAKRGTLEGAHGPIAFLANMMGYAGQFTNFEPYRVLDMNAPCLGLKPLEVDDRDLIHGLREKGNPAPAITF